jgi:hypothetical protein
MQTDQKRPNFCFRYFPQFSTLMEIPEGTPWKMVENRTLKWGSSPPQHTVRAHATSKVLICKHLRHECFLCKTRNTDNYFRFSGPPATVGTPTVSPGIELIQGQIEAGNHLIASGTLQDAPHHSRFLRTTGRASTLSVCFDAEDRR